MYLFPLTCVQRQYISDTLNRSFLVGCDWCVDDSSDEDTGTDDEVAGGDDVGPSGDISLVMALSLLSVSDYLDWTINNSPESKEN